MLNAAGQTVLDLGTDSDAPCDYPDFVRPVAASRSRRPGRASAASSVAAGTGDFDRRPTVPHHPLRPLLARARSRIRQSSTTTSTSLSPGRATISRAEALAGTSSPRWLGSARSRARASRRGAWARSTASNSASRGSHAARPHRSRSDGREHGAPPDGRRASGRGLGSQLRTPCSVLAGDGATGAVSLEDLVKRLAPPRAVWVMVPAGEPTEQTVDGARRACSTRATRSSTAATATSRTTSGGRAAAGADRASTMSTSGRAAASGAPSAATA